MHSGLGTQVSQDLLDVTGQGKLAEDAGFIANNKPAKLDWCVHCHIYPQLGCNSELFMLEDAVAKAVPAGIRRLAPGRKCGRRPEISTQLISNV